MCLIFLLKGEKKLAYVFYVKGLRGYGDYLFALKTCSHTKKHLNKAGYNSDVILVTSSEEGKEIITNLGGDKEFNVTVLSAQEYHSFQSQEDFTLDYYIEGPIMDVHRPKFPKETPVLLLSEYSVPSGVDSHSRELISSGYKNIKAIFSGLQLNSRQKGIIISENLVAVAKAKEQGDFRFRQDYWKELDDLNIRASQSIADYHQSTELYFEATHNIYGGRNICEHFLFVHNLFTEKIQKNQDIISIGESMEEKKSALKSALPTLKESKFNKIIFVDLETHKEEVLYNDGQENQKVYRMLYTKKLTHKQMDALHAVSNDLAGERGDQLHGEGVSSQKIIVYECLPHKEKYAEGFIDTLYNITGDDKVKDLAELLQHAQLNKTAKDFDPVKQNRLRELLNNEEVIKKYKNACHQISVKYNLNDIITSIVTKPFLDLQNKEIYQPLFEKMINTFKQIQDKYPSKGIKSKFRLLFFTPDIRDASIDVTEKFIAILKRDINLNKISYKVACEDLKKHIKEVNKALTDHKGSTNLISMYNKILTEEEPSPEVEKKLLTKQLLKPN